MPTCTGSQTVNILAYSGTTLLGTLLTTTVPGTQASYTASVPGTSNLSGITVVVQSSGTAGSHRSNVYDINDQ
jgi:hypothetical protein